MDIITIILIAIGLAMDAFAVAISNGITISRFHLRFALKISVFFGLFQALMPVLGWFAGLSFRNYIEPLAHWIAFLILVFLGIKMIYESKKMENCDAKTELSLFTIFMLSIATSIDALAVGITLSILEVNIVEPAIIIGIVTLILSFIGVYIGTKCHQIFQKKIEILGGIVLILIGIKILIEHLFFQ